MSILTDTIKKLRIFVQEHIRGTVPGDSIVGFFKVLGVNDWFTRILYTQDCKTPSNRMLNTEKYFTEHRKELEQVADLLADELSKEVFFRAARYRATHDPNDAPVYSRHDQYFVKDIVPLSEEEVFIDCGAFDGDTMKEFIKAAKGKYNRIVCFEPMEKYHARLEKRGAGKRVTAICAGVHKETTTLYFHADQGKGSSLASSADEHTIQVPVRAIDDTPECQDATFIKMDVEGSEMNALRGAKETILRNKPKLAICIYHKNRDFIEIPAWIHKLVPEYKLYVRHHSFSVNETVLYAIPPEKK